MSTTLQAIQQLTDGQFHQLGDDLIRRLETRYRRLRTHGLNDRGESIKGQPDSYVGDTAATASIAVCYTVQRAGWWSKVVEDVQEAIAACPTATEIVVVIPHNSDRDGPKGAKGSKGAKVSKSRKGSKDKSVDWLSTAKTAAKNATVRVLDGRDISQLLDKDHQDLRHEHLGIPYSRLSALTILTGCRTATNATLDSIETSGRYDPVRYSARSADQELYRLWQSAFRRSSDNDRVAPIRLIALVNDSGLGKTSLVCEFARTLGTVLPVLLLQARDLTLDSDHSLVASVLHAIQGFLDPSVRVTEEAALSKLLARSTPLTVVVDGLDEAHNPEGVRKAINYWLKSSICQVSILIATSRREFWRTCVDPSWVRWMPKANSNDRSPIQIADRSQVEKSDPISGIRLPGRFNEHELELAWDRAGRPRSELYTLAVEARDELRHPFTLRVFLDIQMREGGSLPTVTRAALLDRWLNDRLDAEADPTERITRDQFQQALRMLASRIAETNANAISVDDLTGVPRFDPAHPPGVVNQRLIEAGILETLPNQIDHIRFTVEAVQDFYRAEADFEAIKINAKQMAEAFDRLTFTAAYPRLVRLGFKLVGDEVRHEFILQLLEKDPKKAAIVLRASPNCYAENIRVKITEELGAQIGLRHRVKGAMAITLLGELDCTEAIETLKSRLLTPTGIHSHLKSLGAAAFTKLSYAPAANIVYRWERFGVRGGSDAYYFRELLGNIREASPEFRAALGDQAVQQLLSTTDPIEDVRAVTVLGYLGDERLVEHLSSRLAKNGLLKLYENHALVAVGSNAAGALFAQSVIAVAERLSPLADDLANNDARNNLLEAVWFLSADVRYLITPLFASHLRPLIENVDKYTSLIASQLAKMGRVSSLFYSVAIASSTRKEIGFDRGDERDCVHAELWLKWWSQSTEGSLRRKLLTLLPLYPNAEIEKVLMDCLDMHDLRGAVSRKLGDLGALRSAVRLREILAEDITADDRWEKAEVAYALGELRDNAGVAVLEKVAAHHGDGWVVRQAISSLGLIGNLEAEDSLMRLLQLKKGEAFEKIVFEALICNGSQKSISEVLTRARSRRDGVEWLRERLQFFSSNRAWNHGEYYNHIHIYEIVEYLESQFVPSSPEENWELVDVFRQIDCSEIRTFLQKWGSRRGSTEDLLVRESDGRRISDMCYWELRDRGDVSAIGYTLDEGADREDRIYISHTALNLQTFPTPAVAHHLRLRLKEAKTTSETMRMLSLLGRFGEQTDAGLTEKFLDDADDSVANAACDAFLRLRDPMLVPDHW